MRILTLLAVALVVGACSPTTPSQPPASSSPTATACAAQVDRGVLPVWARTGFTDPEPKIPHVVGRSGEIAAILFGDPLSSPPSADHANKILWVSRQDTASAPVLAIRAQRMDGTAPVGAPVDRQVDGGPGPSFVDLPDPGCWRLTLSWGDRTDTLDLEYVGPG
jgi:hypothetical protein